MKICIIGSGSFATTMAVVLANNMIHREIQTELSMFIRREDLFKALVGTRRHPDYEALKSVPIPSNLSFTRSLQDALTDATHCVFAVPSRYSADTLRDMASFFPSGCKVVSLVKGFSLSEDNARFLRMSTLISRSLNIPLANVCCLSGPNIYHEIALNYSDSKRTHRPCNALISSISSSTAKEFQELYFADGILRTYFSDDMVASEVCGALKNVYAIASGAADGHHSGAGMGINFKASLLTRSAYELSYFVRALGGKPESVYGLAGIGDMIATCTRGRNWEAGNKLVSGVPVVQVEQMMRPNVLEGLQTLRVVHQWLNALRSANPALCIELPILEATYKFVYEQLDFEAAVEQVISRPMKKEMRMDPYIATDIS